MKRIISGILGMILVCSLAGCGKIDTNVPMPEEQAMSCEEAAAKILEESGLACDVQESFGEQHYATYFAFWYDMPMEFIADGSICYVEAGDNADEITVLYPESSVTYATVKKALERRKERRVKDFTNLIDSEAKKAEEAVIYEEDGFIIYIVGRKA